ncbi:MAG: response regulator transcription factor [Alphaproteobacteria bacterium]|nr:response regulator transcription factor [Alphaproteobacteria bacterium]
MGRITVVIADPHPIFLCGLTNVLGVDKEFDVLASFTDGTKCIQFIRDHSPNVALVDLFMLDMPSLDFLATAASERLDTRFVFHATSVLVHEAAAAIIGGAYGVIPKAIMPDTLLDCIRQVAIDRKLFPLTSWWPELARCQANDGLNLDALSVLTPREREITYWASQGLSNKHIGHKLNISAGTVKVHMYNIYHKCGISDRARLAEMIVTHPGGDFQRRSS